VSWSSEQLANANAIIRVGQGLGASQRDIVVALMAAMQESGLRNLNYGDRDSIGLFQQRNAWGSTAERLNPESAAKMFFLGGHAGQRGLLDFSNRNSMSLSQAAQAVQVSAYPDAYAKWESQATALAGNPKLPKGVPAAPTGAVTTTTTQKVPMSGLDSLLQQPDQQSSSSGPSALGEVTADSMGLGEVNLDSTLQQQQAPQDPMASLHAVTKLANQAGAQGAPSSGATAMPTDIGGGNSSVVSFARKFLGVPYVWGGTSPTGFDCSGFVQYVYKHMGVNLPRISSDQARAGKRIGFQDLRPGDLVAVDNSSRNAGADHIGIYVGKGLVINAPHPGASVQLDTLNAFNGGWGVRL
jgi:cell wall-associated NlpC family hydrolase